MFRIAALWNLVLGISGVILYSLCMWMILGSYSSSVTDITMIFYRFFMIAVVIFGIGYLIVSVDLEKNDGIVWMGAFAKIIIFIYVIFYFITDKVTIFFLIIALADLIFAAFFFMYLFSKKRSLF
jgi:hypothetical protein